jgi:PilZ domain
LTTEREEKEAKPRYGIVNLETGRSRRFPVHLPVEYYRVDSPINQTREALDGSEDKLQILFPEQMEIGQTLHLKLFFTSGSELNTIEMLAQIIWINALAGDEKHCPSGVRFINISPGGTTKLKTFLSSLS